MNQAAVWAHRGASAAEPENTVSAFVAAKRLGADGVELDVRHTRDRALVVFHDDRLADGAVVAESLVDAVPDEVPDLETALDACLGMAVNIEIKNLPTEAGFDPTCRVVDDVVAVLAGRRTRGVEDDVIISSFHVGNLDHVAALDPSLSVGVLTFIAPDPVEGIAIAADRGWQAIHPHHSQVTEELVADAHAKGIAVNVWTVDDPGLMGHLLDLGVDALITNLPDVAREVVDTRG